MTVLVGRRRIGKTSLIRKSIENQRAVYLFLSKKSEVLLCAEFLEEVKMSLEVPFYGEIKTFKELFSWIMDLSAQQNFTLVLDEFQEFYHINPSVFSEIQHVWDTKKDESKINLILCGSIYSLMHRIFENAREPLFSRATAKIHLKGFDLPTQKAILKDYSPDCSREDLFSLYLFTGGVAKYVENFVNVGALTRDAMIGEILRENSLLLEEGKNVLIEEFGKDYGTYFSILSLIAGSRTSRPEMESILEVSLGAYLERLETDFALIKRVVPILSKHGGRQIKYQVEDNYLNFWFRFIYRFKSAIEIGNFRYVREIVDRDYTTFAGRTLEKYFIEKLKSEGNFSSIGTYWEKANQNEIDIVALNELEKKAIIAEVKWNKSRISENELKYKARNLLEKLKGYQVEYQGFSIEDI
jgi:uncharacterized protein